MKSKALLVILLMCGAIAGLISCMHTSNAANEKLPEVVSYNFHIRPIFF